MLKDAIEYICKLAEQAAGPFVVNGKTFTARPLTDPLATPPAWPMPLELSTLSGIVDMDSLVEESDGAQGPGSLLVHVAAHGAVRVYGPEETHGRNVHRRLLAKAAPIGPVFTVGSFLPIDAAITQLLACFDATEALKDLLKVVGNIRDEAVKVLADDGVTQVVTARTGIVLSSVVVPNPVTLHPRRSFAEVPVQGVQYAIRLRQNDDALPSFALFDADGGRGEIATIAAIKAYLVAAGLSVIA